MKLKIKFENKIVLSCCSIKSKFSKKKSILNISQSETFNLRGALLISLITIVEHVPFNPSVFNQGIQINLSKTKEHSYTLLNQ